MNEPVERVAKAIFDHMFAPHERSRWDTDDWLRNRYLDCASAAIAAMPKSEWQPIKTAKKDSNRVVLAKYVGHYPWWMTLGKWSEKWGNWTDGLENIDSPTHWMELPEPPETS